MRRGPLCKGRRLVRAVCALKVYRGNSWWSKARHNWNQVCNGGIALGELSRALCVISIRRDVGKILAFPGGDEDDTLADGINLGSKGDTERKSAGR